MDQDFNDINDSQDAEYAVTEQELGGGFDSPEALMADLGYEEEMGELTGGTPIPAASPAFPKPGSPARATALYGDYGRGSCYSGEVRLPRLTGITRAINCHQKLVPVVTDLINAIYRDHDHLIQTISGYAQRKRENMPPRFGDKSISPTAWGLAITINRAYNAEGSPDPRRPVGHPISLTRGSTDPVSGEIIQPQAGYTFYGAHPIVLIAQSMGWCWMGAERLPNGEANIFPDPATYAWITGW